VDILFLSTFDVIFVDLLVIIYYLLNSEENSVFL